MYLFWLCVWQLLLDPFCLICCYLLSLFFIFSSADRYYKRINYRTFFLVLLDWSLNLLLFQKPSWLYINFPLDFSLSFVIYFSRRCVFPVKLQNSDLGIFLYLCVSECFTWAWGCCEDTHCYNTARRLFLLLFYWSMGKIMIFLIDLSATSTKWCLKNLNVPH